MSDNEARGIVNPPDRWTCPKCGWRPYFASGRYERVSDVGLDQLEKWAKREEIGACGVVLCLIAELRERREHDAAEPQGPDWTCGQCGYGNSKKRDRCWGCGKTPAGSAACVPESYCTCGVFYGELHKARCAITRADPLARQRRHTIPPAEPTVNPPDVWKCPHGKGWCSPTHPCINCKHRVTSIDAPEPEGNPPASMMNTILDALTEAREALEAASQTRYAMTHEKIDQAIIAVAALSAAEPAGKDKSCAGA